MVRYRLTVVVNNHILCILVAQPVSLSAVREVNYLGLEASSLHHGMICLRRCRVDISTEQRICQHSIPMSFIPSSCLAEYRSQPAKG
jgi:hypothetical protein